ncbi:MAG: hypothetical protein ACYCZ6_14215, partial [Polaromonas sp.]
MQGFIDALLVQHAGLAHQLQKPLDLLKPQDRVHIRYQEEGSELGLNMAIHRGGKSPMHYLSARVILELLLTSPAARKAGSRGDTRESFEIDKQTSIPKDVFLTQALATPALFFGHMVLENYYQNWTSALALSNLKCNTPETKPSKVSHETPTALQATRLPPARDHCHRPA